MINLDMLGRPLLQGHFARRLVPSPDETIGYVLGGDASGRTLALLLSASRATGVAVAGVPEPLLAALGFRSDSTSFSGIVPTLFLSTSIHDDYHQVTDTPEKLDVTQMVRAVHLVRALLELAGRPHP
jgi:hypothetical protein